MATYYDYVYCVDGEYLAILQKGGVTSYSPEPVTEEIYLTPENDDTAGIMMEYVSNKSYPSDETSTLDVSRPLALAIADYVRHRFHEDAGNEKFSEKYYRKFRERISKEDRNKSGDPFVVIPRGAGVLR